MHKPKDIKIEKSKGLLTIEWDDGHVSEYPLPGLRAACPCASCQGGHDNMGGPGSPELLEIPLTPSQGTKLESAEIVGNYALQLNWQDGHRWGIYRWDYLRELCPCGMDHSGGA